MDVLFFYKIHVEENKFCGYFFHVLPSSSYFLLLSKITCDKKKRGRQEDKIKGLSNVETTFLSQNISLLLTFLFCVNGESCFKQLFSRDKHYSRMHVNSIHECNDVVEKIARLLED